MKRYKVLVVDDSAFMRKIIRDLIESDPRFEVVSAARNGKEALEKVRMFKPDAVTLDVEMPVMNGLEALKRIMREQPVPVIMISSLTREGARETILALEYGAVDFVAKPSGSISLDLHKVKQELLEKLSIAVRSRRQTGIRPEPAPVQSLEPSREKQKTPVHSKTFRQIVAIGTSTGGPRALQQVLTQIPESFPAPILVVQHMPPKFTASLAQRLDSLSSIHVVEGEHHCPLQPGVAYIAPGGWHMSVEKQREGNYRIVLDQEAPRGGHRPSVDRLFESLLPLRELRRHLVIMTGMGSDGVKAMKDLKDAGAETTIAEAEETCVVYGMPRAAVEMKAARDVLPVGDIPGKLIEKVNLYETKV